MFFFFLVRQRWARIKAEDDRIDRRIQRPSFSTAVCFVHIYPVTKCGSTVTKGERRRKVPFREFYVYANE